MDRVLWRGAPPSSRLLDDWALEPGRVFTEATLQAEINALLESLADQGHTLATLSIDSLAFAGEPGAPGIDLWLSLDPGPLIRVASVSVRGNTLTQGRFILRESRIRTGQVYKPSLTEKAVETLDGLGYFKPLTPPEVRLIGDQAHVQIVVEEGNTYRFDGVLGWVPATTDRERGYVTGQMAFSLRNLFGTGRDFVAEWQKKDRLSQTMNLRYAEPWIAGWPLSAAVAFSQEIKDSSYVSRDWQLEAAWSPLARLELGAAVHWGEVLPDSAQAVLLAIPKSQSTSVTTFIRYDALNDPVNPSGGLSLEVEAESGDKRHRAYLTEGMKASESLRRLRIDFNFAQPLGGRHVAFLGLHGAEVRTAHVDAAYQVRLGGTQTLRGYREDAFTGHRAVWLNAEYRFLTGRRSRLFVFADGGRIESDAQTLVRWGYGFGLRFETRLGVIGVDYGLGQGDTWMRGKVHVGLMNQF